MRLSQRSARLATARRLVNRGQGCWRAYAKSIVTRLSPALWLLVDSLASFRLTRLVTADTLFDRPRGWATRRMGLKASDFLGCPWCVGMWLSAAVLTATLLWPRQWVYPALVFAFGAVAGMLGQTFL